MGFWDSFKNQVKDSRAKLLAEEEQKKQHIKDMDDQGIPYCPKCLSTSLSAQKKGVSVAKGLAGAAILPLGILAGGIGRNNIELHCLKCGNKFRP